MTDNKPTQEDIKEVLARQKPKSHMETYQSEIVEYMTSKLKDYNVPIHTIMEIAQYCMQATVLVSNDEVRRAYRYWNNAMKKSARKRSTYNVE